MRRRFILSLLCLSFSPALFAAKSDRFDAPALTCGAASAESIDVTVSAGPSGAPAGFTVQWVSADDYAAYGWTNAISYCDASFSGNANDSRYDLAPNASTTVTIGRLVFDNGASTSCNTPLICGRAYVFRVFAHATSTTNRSNFSQSTSCSTVPCAPVGCTYTKFYWPTHLPPTLDLGSVAYSDAQLLAILTTVAPDPLGALGQELIAAKLNVANGADPADAIASIDAADALIGAHVIGTDSLPLTDTESLTTVLKNYNEGVTGPGHCSDEPPPDPGKD